MSFEQSDLEKTAHLARLTIDPSDLTGFARNLSDILAFVDQLNEAETDGVLPMAHPLDRAQRLRADRVTETDQRDRFQAIAPAVEDGLYLVPKVID